MTDWDKIDDDLVSIMEETPVGENHGSALTSIPTGHGVTGAYPGAGTTSASIVYAKTSPHVPRKTLNAKDHEAQNGTQGVTSDEREFHYLGMVAHRGVLHKAEFVDFESLVFALEMRLGFTVERVQFLYSKPNPSAKDLPDKIKLEDTFLELAESGGNMGLLGSILGFVVEGDRCRVISRSVARARSRRGV